MRFVVIATELDVMHPWYYEWFRHWRIFDNERKIVLNTMYRDDEDAQKFADKLNATRPQTLPSTKKKVKNG